MSPFLELRSRARIARRRPGPVALAILLTLVCAVAVCALAAPGSVAAQPTTRLSVVVPFPASGAVEAAFLHFELAPGVQRPVLIVSGAQGLPKSVALVTGVSRWHADERAFTGLVAIASFRPVAGARGAGRARSLHVTSSAPFTLDYLGPVKNGCGSAGVCPRAALEDAAQLTGWHAGESNLPSAALEPSFRSAAGVLTQVTYAMVGAPTARWQQALARTVATTVPSGPPTGAGGTAVGPTSGATPGLTASATLIAAPGGSLGLRVQNTGAVPITSVTLAGIDFTITSLPPSAGAGCRLVVPGLVCDAGFSILPGQSLQFTIAAYTCCLIGGQVWINSQTGAGGQFGPIVASLG